MRNRREIETATQRQDRHKATECATILNKLRYESDIKLDSMEYFYKLYEKVYIKKESLHKDKIKVGTMCIQVPSEIIYALDAVPIRLCNGFYTDSDIGSDYANSKACPLIKATIGEFSLGNFAHKPDIVISPTTCDQKSKSGAIIESFGYNVYDMEFPRTKESEESRDYWRRSVRKFSKDLSNILNKKLKRGKLKESIKKVAYAQYIYHQLNSLRKLKYPPISGNDMFLLTNSFFFDDIDSWIEATKNVLNEAKNRVNSVKKNSIRIVYTGSPPIFPNLKVPLIIEQSDGIIVADESCSSNRMFNDMVSVDEWFLSDMIDSIAYRYLKGCTCPIFTKNSDRVRRVVELVKEYNAQGVVYQSFAGCQVYEMEQRTFLSAMEQEGIATLYIESDYSPSHLGQLTTRVEAFIESLKNRRRREQ